MARPKAPVRAAQSALVSGNADLIAAKATSPALAASASVFRNNRKANPSTDRAVIAKPWQMEAYRHVNICGEARYAVTLFAATAGRAEIGISEPQALVRKAVWVKSGPEVDALAEIAPTVRERSKLVRDFMLHWTIAGEMYLIARDRVDSDPGYEEDPNAPVWEIVAVSELQKVGSVWRVRHENGNFVDLKASDPIIRIWNPDPADRQEAWSPFRSLLPTLREIEWLTKHIFTQVQSRLMSAGVWFLPDNLTFPAPPVDAVEGGAEAIAAMNEAEQFMASLAASSMSLLEGDEVAFPSIVMADAAALSSVDQNKLIQFWSEIDDKAMSLRSDAIRRFALGMDLPPEQVLGSSGVAVTNSGGSAGCVDEATEILTREGWKNHWDIKPGVEILTLNHDTGVSEWQPVQTMNRYKVENEPMLRMQGVGHDSVTTMNHRWAVLDREGRRKFVTSDSLNQGHRIPTAAPHADFPVEAKYTDAFVELVAWWWTEGCISGATESRADEPYTDSLGRHYPNGNGSRSGRFGRASIAQSHVRNPERVESIRAALNTVFPSGWGSEHVRTTKTGFGAPVTDFSLRREVWEALHAVAPAKVVSTDFIMSLTKAQVELFIQTSCAGDGWHYRQGKLDIWQRDPEVLEAFELALILSGRSVSESWHAGGKCVNGGVKTTVRPFHAAAAPGARMSITQESLTGTVWCPTVENGTWMARRGGTAWFTGNSTNHWGIWAMEEQTISAHVEPALDALVGTLTTGFLRLAVEGTQKVVAYDTAALRLRQDRSKEALEWYDRGVLKAEVAVRESGFDPANDMMSPEEHKMWLLNRIAGGSATPEQVQAALALMGVALPVSEQPSDPRISVEQVPSAPAPGISDRNLPPSLESHPYEGPPRVQHDHSPAPFGTLGASCEGLVLRALEKAGNRLLNDGKRGREKDRTTPPHLAHLTAGGMEATELPAFDFTLLPTVLAGLSARKQAQIATALTRYCIDLYSTGTAYSREGLITALEGL